MAFCPTAIWHLEFRFDPIGRPVAIQLAWCVRVLAGKSWHSNWDTWREFNEGTSSYWWAGNREAVKKTAVTQGGDNRAPSPPCTWRGKRRVCFMESETQKAAWMGHLTELCLLLAPLQGDSHRNKHFASLSSFHPLNPPTRGQRARKPIWCHCFERAAQAPEQGREGGHGT